MTAPGGFELTPREGPGHAGVGATFCGRPLVHEPSGLEGVDVAVLGAPFDDGASNRPGARFGPRAIRAADGGRGGRPDMTLGVDPFDGLNVVDYGDAEVAPGDLGARASAGRDPRCRRRAGTWPGPDEFDWMRAEGFRWHTMQEIQEQGLRNVFERAAGRFSMPPASSTSAPLTSSRYAHLRRRRRHRPGR